MVSEDKKYYNYEYGGDFDLTEILKLKSRENLALVFFSNCF